MRHLGFEPQAADPVFGVWLLGRRDAEHNAAAVLEPRWIESPSTSPASTAGAAPRCVQLRLTGASRRSSARGVRSVARFGTQLSHGR